MADQGAIGVAAGGFRTPPSYLIASWWSIPAGVALTRITPASQLLPVWKADVISSSTTLLTTDTSGRLAGTVLYGSTPLQDVWVSVYYRGGTKPANPGGGNQLIARVKTDVNGAWTLYGFEVGKAYYTVEVEVPDSLKANYNSIVFDNVVPV